VPVRRTLALVSAAAVLAACATGHETEDATSVPAPPAVEPEETPSDPEPETPPEDDEPDEVEVTVTDVATDLDAPWDVTWLGDRVLLTERDTGRLLELADDGSTREVRTFDVDADGEGGLLGLAAGPDDLLYVYLTTASDNRVVRLDPDDGDPEVVLDGIPAERTHNGGRIAFGPDGMLYVATGDAQVQPASQDPDSLAGKILRITPEGDVPGDNPFDGSPVWSFGHRNVQGLAFDAEGRLFAPEFGPDVDDEVNLIEPGGNYGWPDVTGEAGAEGFTDPILTRQPPEASWSGGAVLTDGAIPQWEGDLFVAALRGERLWRLPLTADGTLDGEPEELYVGEHGRLREVTQAPDGSLWVLTNNRDGRGSPRDDDDRILRIGPSTD
jgi:glucose/arabinose dehydrogenase